MNKYGYIKLPRSINTLKGVKRWLLAHICSEVAYCTTEHPACGKIERGEMITSRAQLAEDVGLTLMQVRRALESLESLGYITVEAAARYTKITVTWPDFVQLRDNDIMLNDPMSNQVMNPMSNQVATSASVEVSASYEGLKNEEAQSGTQRGTQRGTNICINNKENNKYTHSNSIYPVSTKSAGARDAHTRVSEQGVELVEWMMHNTPDYFTMAYPFTDEDIASMVEGYAEADLRRILATAWSKGACQRHRSARVAFQSFADHDKALHERIAERQGERLYTYEEMCDFIHRHGGTSDQYFSPVAQPTGKPLWKRIN